jgi:UDP-glucuronate 4-epimerase
MKVLVTGAAGFIGSHVSQKLLDRGDEVVGIDNLNAYYDPQLKQARLNRLEKYASFSFRRTDVSDRSAMEDLFTRDGFARVVHLGAQAGVRHSLQNPHSYMDTNIQGFMNVLEGCRHASVEHLVYASSSSVYGGNESLPYSEQDNVDHPLSIYAVTKKANELMAHSYSHLFRLPTTGLRFFTVYGPWGRPDMAYFVFTRNILEEKPIQIFNNGKHARDFTYIDDIVEGLVRVLDKVATANGAWSGKHPDPATSSAPYRIYNIGSNNPVQLMDFVGAIERALGKKAQFEMLPKQAGDIEQTYADIESLKEAVGFQPATPIDKGIAEFVSWYRSYYDHA